MAISGMCIAIFLFLSWNGAREHAEIRKLDDSQKYVIDFSPLLGEEWEVSDPVRNDEDIVGWDVNVAGRTFLTTYRLQGEGAVTHEVISYPNVEVALARYLKQEALVFVYDYGVPPSRQDYSYEDVTFSINTNPHADKQRIACKVIRKIEVQCAGLFLYGNHVVFVNTYRVRNFVEYVTMVDLQRIFSAIDEKMV
jgi:hypothetical protein